MTIINTINNRGFPSALPRIENTGNRLIWFYNCDDPTDANLSGSTLVTLSADTDNVKWAGDRVTPQSIKITATLPPICEDRFST